MPRRSSALLAFALTIILGKLAGAPWFSWNGETVSAQAWGFHVASSIIPEPHLASLACDLARSLVSNVFPARSACLPALENLGDCRVGTASAPPPRSRDSVAGMAVQSSRRRLWIRLEVSQRLPPAFMT